MPDVHTSHCCSVCGCKYDDDSCTVKTGKERQELPHALCDEYAEIPVAVTRVILAWHQASAHKGTAFYEAFHKATGITEEQVNRLFGDWNRLSHEDADDIAREMGVTLRHGGFQAYLAKELKGAVRVVDDSRS